MTEARRAVIALPLLKEALSICGFFNGRGKGGRLCRGSPANRTDRLGELEQKRQSCVLLADKTSPSRSPPLTVKRMSSWIVATSVWDCWGRALP